MCTHVPEADINFASRTITRLLHFNFSSTQHSAQRSGQTTTDRSEWVQQVNPPPALPEVTGLLCVILGQGPVQLREAAEAGRCPGPTCLDCERLYKHLHKCSSNGTFWDDERIFKRRYKSTNLLWRSVSLLFSCWLKSSWNILNEMKVRNLNISF